MPSGLTRLAEKAARVVDELVSGVVANVCKEGLAREDHNLSRGQRW